jgi:hypothetical protein
VNVVCSLVFEVVACSILLQRATDWASETLHRGKLSRELDMASGLLLRCVKHRKEPL